MLTTLAFLFAGPSFAAGLEFPKNVDTRSYKFEWYSQVDLTRPRSTDFNWIDLEFYSGIVECKRVELTETCTFKDQEVHHGFHPKDAKGVDTNKIDVPGTLTIEWADTGRMKRYDFTGNSDEFWTTAEVSVRPYYKRMRKLSQNGVRRIGLQVEQALARKVIGLLEVERTPSKTFDRPWEPTSAPWAARRFETQDFQVGASKPKLSSQVVAQENGMAVVTTTGVVTESLTVYDNGIDVKTEYAGEAVIDLQSGMLVLNQVRTQTGGRYPNMLNLTQLLFPYQEGMTPAPGELPGNPLAGSAP